MLKLDLNIHSIMKNIILLLMLPIFISAQSIPEIKLWKDGAPGAKGDSIADIPAVYYYSGDKNISKAVVICPGGGYNHLSLEKEGFRLAKWFNSIGYHAFVLRYRHNNKGSGYNYPAPFLDALRAMRYARFYMKNLGYDSAKVGIMGFSAGGHLASSVSTHFDIGKNDALDEIERFSSRPDFSILIYPVITLTDSFMHKGSRKNFIGIKGDTALAYTFSNDKHVTKDTPPTFIVHAMDDKAVPVQNSLVYYDALLQNRVKSEMHLLPEGGHGFGMSVNKPSIGRWVNYLKDWLMYSNF